MFDRTSDQLIQQITGEVKREGQHLPAYPNTMMTWKSFKALHPNATVFLYQFNRPLDKILQAIFLKSPLASCNEEAA